MILSQVRRLLRQPTRRAVGVYVQSSPPAPCGASIHLYVHTVRPHLPHGALLLPLQLGYRPIQIQFIEAQEVKPLRPPCPFKQMKSKIINAVVNIIAARQRRLISYPYQTHYCTTPKKRRKKRGWTRKENEKQKANISRVGQSHTCIAAAN